MKMNNSTKEYETRLYSVLFITIKSFLLVVSRGLKVKNNTKECQARLYSVLFNYCTTFAVDSVQGTG